MTMSVQRDTLKEEYKVLILDDDYNAKAFQIKCIDLLEGLDVNSCFKFLPFGEILNGFLKKAEQQNKAAKFENLEDVIKHLEKYAKNLLTKPWCKDFYTINIFNGFFKYKIEQWIPVEIACKVLKFIGYQISDESPGIYQIEKLDVDRLIMIGFDLYLGHTQLFAFSSSPYLANYPLDQIMEARNETTGDPIKMIEWIKHNGFLMERPSVISETLQETTTSNRVTTAFQREYFDKNGQSSQETVKYPPNETDLHGEHMEMDYPSLPSAEILDKELYGDETDSTIQDSSQKRPATYSYTANPVLYTAQSRTFMSLPPEPTKDRGQCDARLNQLRIVANQGNHGRSHPMKEQFKTRSSKQRCALARGQSTMTPDSRSENVVMNDSCEQAGLYVELEQPHNNKGLPECMLEHLQEMNNPEMSRDEKLGQVKYKRVDKILEDRIKAGEEDIHQKSATPSHFGESVVDGTSKMIENQCYICGYASVIGCKKCEKIACQVCSSIMKKGHCISNEDHEYYTLDSNDNTLNNKDTGLPAVSQVSKTDQSDSSAQRQLTDAGFEQKVFLPERMLEKQCYLCNGTSVIGCKKCKRVVCRKCLSIVKKAPCVSNEDHEYYILDDTKWQCKHCTCFNQPETTVCLTCSRSKDFTAPQLSTGDWVCDNCTLINASSLQKCKVCKENKSHNTYI